MSWKVEHLEHNMVKLTIEVGAERFEEAMQRAYLNNRSRIHIPGFRAGKVPRLVIEKMYGPGIFFEDAANDLIPDAYEDAVKESGLFLVSRPEIEIEQIGKGEPFIFTAEVAVKPEVTLGAYKYLEAPEVDCTVTEEDIQSVIDEEREQNARLVAVEGRGAQKGDHVTFDFAGTVDGEPFEGGTAQGYELELGSGRFIPGFEAQLEGAVPEEDREVAVIFPENYHVATLAGKPAVFQCHIQDVREKELPEVDDEFAQDVSDCETLEEYREQIRKELTEDNERDARVARERALVALAVENASMDIPDAMVENQIGQMEEEFARNLYGQNMDLDQYLELVGKTREEMHEEMRPEALERIQNSLTLEAIAQAENLEPSEEQVREKVEELAKRYRRPVEEVEKLLNEEDFDRFRNEIRIQLAVDFLMEHAKEA